jgi:hypothetical protein
LPEEPYLIHLHSYQPYFSPFTQQHTQLLQQQQQDDGTSHEVRPASKHLLADSEAQWAVPAADTAAAAAAVPVAAQQQQQQSALSPNAGLMLRLSDEEGTEILQQQQQQQQHHFLQPPPPLQQQQQQLKKLVAPSPDEIWRPGEPWGSGGRWIEPWDDDAARETIEKLLAHWLR